VEFEQIYDEYLYLCNDSQAQVNKEEISISKLEESHFLTNEEKDAILNSELPFYIAQIENNPFSS